MKNSRMLWVTATFLVIWACATANAFYSPAQGRWLSRDPIEEAGGLNLFAMLDSDPINSVDLYGLFGDGHDGRPTRRVCRFVGNPSRGGRWVCRDVPVTILGHSDFPNLAKCPFDFTREDRWETHPWIQPGRHFQPLAESEAKLDEALQSCNFSAYERAMHQMQDFYAHYDNGYRWDPGFTNKCWGLGHLCVPRGEVPPDEDMEGWERARERTQYWLGQWSAKCCIKKCSKCKWIRREGDTECES